ncbi:hypothetical protein EC968_004051 [Mortierella alpina]|nr:hypothetical protein EC968_004051 [Mortierella alpina]
MTPQDPTKQDPAAASTSAYSSASTTRAPAETHRPSYPRERAIARPSRFHPKDDPLDFLLQFERIARGNNWLDKAKLDTLGVYLEGSAQTWYEDNHHLRHGYGHRILHANCNRITVILRHCGYAHARSS